MKATAKPVPASCPGRCARHWRARSAGGRECRVANAGGRGVPRNPCCASRAWPARPACASAGGSSSCCPAVSRPWRMRDGWPPPRRCSRGDPLPPAGAASAPGRLARVRCCWRWTLFSWRCSRRPRWRSTSCGSTGMQVGMPAARGRWCGTHAKALLTAARAMHMHLMHPRRVAGRRRRGVCGSSPPGTGGLPGRRPARRPAAGAGVPAPAAPRRPSCPAAAAPRAPAAQELCHAGPAPTKGTGPTRCLPACSCFLLL